MQTADRHVVVLVQVPERQCYRADGHPKRPFSSFDEAFEQIASAVGRNARATHVYRCPDGHGWHIGKNK